MTKRYLLFLIPLFALLNSMAYAQSYLIEGKVVDSKTHEPLVGVTVMVIDSLEKPIDLVLLPDYSVPGIFQSDNNGEFKIPVPLGKYDLKFSIIGYNIRIVRGIKIIANTSINLLEVPLEESATQLPITVVSAGKFEQKISDVTVSMQVIKADIIQNKNTVSMEFIMDQVPGVSVVDNQPSIRGGAGWSYGAGSRVLVMMDDMPYLAADAGDVKWSSLPIENINQIEVVEGASSALFGSSALNGVINIRTNYPKDTAQTKVIAYDGVYDSPKNPQMKWWGNTPRTYYGTSVSHSQKIGQLDLVFGGNLYNDHGYRLGETEERYRYNFNLRYRFKNIKGLSVGLNYNSDHGKGFSFLCWQNDSTGALKPLGGVDTVGSSLSSYNTTRTNVDPFATYFDPYGNVHKIRTRWFRSTNINDTHQGAVADLYYGEYQFQRDLKKIHATITAGVTIIQNTVKSDLYGDHNGLNKAAYFQFDKKFHKLTFSFGMRAEYYRIDTANSFSNFEDKIGDKTYKTPVILRAGLNYELFKATWLRTSYGQGFRYPTIGEKFVHTNVGSVYIYPNDSLHSETGWSAEFGIKQGIKISSWMGYLDVAAFWTQYANMMEFTFGQWGSFTQPFFGLGFQSQNIGNAVINGIDVSLVGQGKLGPCPTTVLGGITYMNPYDKYTDSAYIKSKSPMDNFLKYRYNYLMKFDIESSYKKYSLGLSFRYNSFMHTVDSAFVYGGFPGEAGIAFKSVEEYRQQHQNGDFFFDARCAYTFNKHSKLAFIVKNLFNHEAMARPGDILAPRSFVLQYSLTL